MYVIHLFFFGLIFASDDCHYAPSSEEFDVENFASWVQASSLKCATLVINPGTYKIKSPTIIETDAREWHLTLQMLRLKYGISERLDHRIFGSIHLPLTFPLENAVLDMTDVTLVMGDRTSTAVQISSWVNVTLRGLTIAYERYPTNQARIDKVDYQGLEVTVPKGYPLDDWKAGEAFKCNVYAPGTRYIRVGSGDLIPDQLLPNGNGENSYRLLFPRKITGIIEVGDTLGCRAANYANVFHVLGCTRSVFQDITIKGGPGVGVFEGRKRSSKGIIDPSALGKNKFFGIHVTYPDQPLGATAIPVTSAGAASFHSANAIGGPTIANSIFEGHKDDAIALHGLFSLVVDVKNNQIWITTADITVGDHLKIYDSGLRPAGEVKVTKVQMAQPKGAYVPPRNVSKTMPKISLAPEPEQWYLILDLEGDIPKDIGFDWVVISINHEGSRFLIANNTIRNHRARAMLIKASNGIIRDNRIENSTLGGIIVTPELNWGEGGYSSNLTIVNNSITSVCTGVQCYGGIGIGAEDPNDHFVDGPPYGDNNIIIKDNVLRNISQMNIWVSSVQNLEIVNNEIIAAYDYKPVATCCPVVPFPKPKGSSKIISWLTTSDRVKIGKNCVTKTITSTAVELFTRTDSVHHLSISDGGFQRC